MFLERNVRGSGNYSKEIDDGLFVGTSLKIGVRTNGGSSERKDESKFVSRKLSDLVMML